MADGVVKTVHRNTAVLEGVPTATTRYATSTKTLSTLLRNDINLAPTISASDAAASAASQDDSTSCIYSTLCIWARSISVSHYMAALNNATETRSRIT